MIDELLENNIIRQANSEYVSPLLLVKKKDGSDCIDYRKLNSQTVKLKSPLPRTDDQLQRLHGSKYFTTLDLKSG